MRDRAAVRAAFAFHGCVRATARELGVAEGTVRAALRQDVPDHYSRPLRGSAADSIEPELRALLSRFPSITVDAAAREVAWGRSRSALAVKLRDLRAEYSHLPAVPGVRTGPTTGVVATMNG